MDSIVSVNWLKENLDAKDLILLDVSIKKAGAGNTSAEDSQTIAGARFFDIKGKFSDSNSPFPNTLPDAEQFESECQQLGINQTSQIVVFDKLGIYSSPRAWWMFKVMGHENVSVLDGGLPEWIKHGFPTVSMQDKTYETGNFKASFHQDLVKSYQDILENVDQQLFTVIDARSAGRFDGTEPEPRKNLQSGHIANSVNIPFSTVLENGKFKSPEELKKVFEKIESDSKDWVFSCGSGITACVIMLAGAIADKQSRSVFDGSWTEWAERQNLKKEAE